MKRKTTASSSVSLHSPRGRTKNLVVYDETLKSNAKLCSRAVPYGREQPPSPAESAEQIAAVREVTEAALSLRSASKHANYSWAELMRRTFAVDVV